MDINHHVNKLSWSMCYILFVIVISLSESEFWLTWYPGWTHVHIIAMVIFHLNKSNNEILFTHQTNKGYQHGRWLCLHENWKVGWKQQTCKSISFEVRCLLDKSHIGSIISKASHLIRFARNYSTPAKMEMSPSYNWLLWRGKVETTAYISSTYINICVHHLTYGMNSNL